MKTLLSALAGLALIFLGEELAMYVYSNYYQNTALGWLGVLAVIILLAGSILVCIPIVNMSQQFDQWTKKTNKSKLFKALTFTPLLVLCFSPFVASVVIFYKQSLQFKREHLEKFGVVKKVEITGTIDGMRSRHDLLFSFEHDGVTYEGMLDRWVYGGQDSMKYVGDSIAIIFSSDNPGEQAWYYNFKQESEASK
ncbi:MAG: hypothetical protein SchgKO_10430 [Schleiferiaceae bacterium]